MSRSWGLLCALLLILDISAKWAVVSWVSPIHLNQYPFGGIGVFSDLFGVSFSLNMVTNTGAIWGVFPNHPAFLFIIRAAIITALLFYLIFFNKGIQSRDKKSLWLVVVGAVGNVLDYVVYGCVIDFLHFNFWGYSFPVFNLADSYIFLGVVFALFFGSFKKNIASPAL